MRYAVTVVGHYTVLAALSEAAGGRLRAYELGRRLGWEKSRLHHQLTGCAGAA